MAGGTSGSPNKLITNTAGAAGKGNQAERHPRRRRPATAPAAPIELDGNTAKANTLVGIKVTGGGTGDRATS